MDGQVLTSEQIGAVYQPGLFQPQYPFELRPGEIACFLSHRKAWQEIIARGLDAALVLEDDVDLVPNVFDDAFRLATASLTGGPDFIQFGLRTVRGRAKLLAQNDDIRLMRPEKVLLGTVGQLVSRQAAAVLLEKTYQFDRPIDVFLQMHWLTGVRPAAVIPSGIVDRTSMIGGSTIHAPKTLLARLQREWKRTIYRWRVGRLSRLHDAQR